MHIRSPAQRHLVERDLLRARPAQLFEWDAFMIEVDLGELLQAVAEATAGIQIESSSPLYRRRRDMDAQLVEHHPSYFRLWPILRTACSSRSGFIFRRTSSIGSWLAPRNTGPRRYGRRECSTPGSAR
jgi:hypothetical protein